MTFTKEKVSTWDPQPQQTKTSVLRVAYALLAILGLCVLPFVSDLATGYPISNSPPAPADISRFFSDDIPLLFDEVLMRFEMVGVDLDVKAEVCPQQPAFVPPPTQQKIELPNEDILAQRLSEAVKVS